MNRISISLQIVLVTLILVPISVVAQDVSSFVGIPQDSTIYPIPGVGFVNLNNGNLHVHIPLREVAERNGTTETASIVYDTSVYRVNEQPGSDGDIFYWATVPGDSMDTFLNSVGVQVSPNFLGQVIYDTVNVPCGPGTGTIPEYTNWRYVDEAGTIHPFPPEVETQQGDAFPNCTNYPNAQGYATDGSGYWIVITGFQSYVVYDLHGNAVANSTSGGDSNGNHPTLDTKDILGRSIFLPSGYTVGTSTINIWTNFGISWITELGPTSMPLVTSITLPDGSAYHFQYDDAGSPPVQGHYGNLTGITLPTGGQISITARPLHYDGVNNPFAVTQISTPDGTWDFSYTPGTPALLYSDSITTATAPPDPFTGVRPQTTCNRTEGGAATHTVSTYAGAVGGTPVRRVVAQVDGYMRTTSVTTTVDSGQSSHVDFTYVDACTSRVATKKEYDFSGNLVREADVSYLTDSNDNHNLCSSFVGNAQPTWHSAYLQNGRHIADLASSVTVYGLGGSSGPPVAQTLYTYDSTPLTTTSGPDGTGSSVLGLAVHDDTNFGASMPYRGNLTAVQEMTSSGNFITTRTNYYNILGALVKSIDGNGNATTYDYSDVWRDASCFPSPVFAYPTVITDALGHQVHKTYDSCTGLVAQTQDENNQITKYVYDGMDRLTETDYPDQGKTTNTYQDDLSVGPASVTTQQQIDSRATWSQTLFDGMGRAHRTETWNDEDVNNPYDQVDTCFDGRGQKYFVSYPYRSTGFNATKACSSLQRPGDTFNYDALGRLTLTTHPDGNTISTDYTQFPIITVTDEPGRARKNQTDALGRLITVWEPDASGNLSYETDYRYDALGNLLCAEQHGGVSGTGCDSPPSSDATSAWRVRRFTYDALSRLLTATNPESGTIQYSYDADGNLKTKTSPAPNQLDPSVTVTEYFDYDPLDRLLSKSFSDGSISAGYVYDQNQLWGVNNLKNTVGRLVGSFEAVNGMTGSVGSVLSYDVMGHAVYENRFNGHVPSWLNEIFNYSYNLDGSLNSVTYPADISQRKVDYGYNRAQRPISVNDAADGIKYYSSALYTPFGAVSSMVYGAGIKWTNNYNVRMQPTLLSAATDTQTIMSLRYELNSCNNNQTNNGNVCRLINGKDGSRTQSFQYDTLNRLTSATSGIWSESYNYDPWGNLLKRNITGTVDPKELALNLTDANGVSTINVKNQADQNWCYDAAGNVLGSQNCSFYAQSHTPFPNVYDDENRLIRTTVDGGVTTSYDYDPDGNRVEKLDADGTATLYWYGPGGVLEETDQVGNMSAQYVFVRGQRIARLDFPNPCKIDFPVHYYFADHLGSASVITNATGSTIEAESDYYPFGGERVIIDLGINNHYKFTGKERDSETGLDYFGARYYGNTIGRFLTPDWADKPTEVPYANFGNPQSLNLYSYVQNNPTTFGDPDGHDCDWCDRSVAFGFGVLRGYVSSKSMGMLGAPRAGDSTSSLNGQVVGTLLETLEGVEHIDTGLTLGGAGLAAEGPSVGVSTVAVVGGAAVTAVGTYEVTGGLSNLGRIAATTMESRNNQGNTGPKAKDAPGVSSSGQATNEHGQKLGASGKPEVHNVNKNTREGANNAANKGSGTINHRNPRRGSPHFHTKRGNGTKKQDNVHYNYPD